MYLKVHMRVVCHQLVTILWTCSTHSQSAVFYKCTDKLQCYMYIVMNKVFLKNTCIKYSTQGSYYIFYDSRKHPEREL